MDSNQGARNMIILPANVILSSCSFDRRNYGRNTMFPLRPRLRLVCVWSAFVSRLRMSTFTLPNTIKANYSVNVDIPFPYHILRFIIIFNQFFTKTFYFFYMYFSHKIKKKLLKTHTVI